MFYRYDIILLEPEINASEKTPLKFSLTKANTADFRYFCVGFARIASCEEVPPYAARFIYFK